MKAMFRLLAGASSIRHAALVLPVAGLFVALGLSFALAHPAAAANGSIAADVTTTREGAPANSPARTGKAEKKCVVTISLAKDGGTTKSGDSKSSWYTLSNGKLAIPDVAAGTYTVTIVYDDRKCMLEDNKGVVPAPQSSWTSDRVTITKAGIIVENDKATNAGAISNQGAAASAAEQQVCSTGDGVAGALAWLICPITELLINATQFIQDNIIIPYLTVSPLRTEDDASTQGVNEAAIYQIWQKVRDVANIAFVLAIFFIIFSQATSIGLSNYGIKRMLPRLAVVAIVTNLSFFGAGLGIDAFNVFGGGISDFVTTALGSIGSSGGTSGQSTSAGALFVLVPAGLAAIVFTGGAALGWLFSLLGLAFLFILVAVVSLILRQMLLIVLVVASPLLAVAWLLPNTEQYATKGRKLFVQLLMMYPLIVLLFASGKIVAALLTSGAFAGQDDQASQAIRAGVGFFAAALPMIALPATFAAAGSFMGRIYGGLTNRARKGAQQGYQAYKSSGFGKYRQQRATDKRLQENMGVYSGRNPVRIARQATKRTIFGANPVGNTFNKVTGGYGAEAMFAAAGSAQERVDSIQKQLGKISPTASQALMAYAGDGDKATFDKKMDGEDADSKAVIERLVRQGYGTNAIGVRAAATALAGSGFLEAKDVKAGAKVFGGNTEELQRYLSDINNAADKGGLASQTQWNIRRDPGNVGDIAQYKMETPRPSLGWGDPNNPADTRTPMPPDTARGDVKTAEKVLSAQKSIVAMKKHAIADGLTMKTGAIEPGSMAAAIRDLANSGTDGKDKVLRDAAGLNGQSTPDQEYRIALILGYGLTKGPDGKFIGNTDPAFQNELTRVRNEAARGKP